jgi:hypothetical protein
MRVRLEAEAMIGLLAAVEDGKVKMVGSAILDFETAQNPNRIRKTFAVEMLRNASAALFAAPGRFFRLV